MGLDKQRNYLIAISIFLGILLFALLLFGIVIVRPAQILNATNFKQHVSFSLKTSSDNGAIKINNVGKFDFASKKDSTKKQDHFPYEQKKQKPKISIIITNLGLNKLPTELALTMPVEIALGFLPYTTSLKPLLYQAKDNGHEIYMSIPFGENNTNKYTISNDLSIEENISKLQNISDNFNGCAGFYSDNYEKFTANRILANSILEILTEHKLTLILNKDEYSNSFNNLFDKKQFMLPNIILDSEADADEIKQKLDRLIEYTKTHQRILAYSYGYAITINMLKEWLPELEKHGIELVPVSALAKELNL